MSKAQLVEKIAKDVDIAKAVAERALNSIIHNITKVVSKGENGQLVGFDF